MNEEVIIQQEEISPNYRLKSIILAVGASLYYNIVRKGKVLPVSNIVSSFFISTAMSRCKSNNYNF